MTLEKGQVLQNRYRIVSILGQGGMAAVYRAWHVGLNVPVAVKEMMPQPGIDAETLSQLTDQFRQEAQTLARLDHPHLVRVSDFFGQGEKAYLVMDFVEGESLADCIEREGSLPEEKVLGWAEELLDALAYCHAQGVIHRDVKPQNVIIGPNEQAVLVDFGLVKLWDPSDPRTKTRMRGMGTPEYAPPEQYDLEMGHTDARSDVYGLGATLYHALSGKAPPTVTLRMAEPEAFEPLDAVTDQVSDDTSAVVTKALELARSRRWQSAAEMAGALGVSVPRWQDAEAIDGAGEGTEQLREAEADGSVGAGIRGRLPQVPLPPWLQRGLTVVWRVTRWTLGKVAAAAVVVTLAIVVLAMGGAFALSALAERTLMAQEWCWAGWEDGGVCTIRERTIRDTMRDTVEPYTLDALRDLNVDLRPPDGVEVEGQLRHRPLQLDARLEARDGRLYIHLERLNGVPLYGIGGIISNGINRGLRSAWVDAPVRLTSLDMTYAKITADLAPLSPSSTREPTATAAATERPAADSGTAQPEEDETRTATERPTSTPRAPTRTPRPAREASPVRTPEAVQPQLVTPSRGREYTNPVTFGWQGSLASGQTYQVVAHHPESGHVVRSEPLSGDQWETTLPGDCVGEWRWKVTVIEGGEVVTESPESMFWFNPFPSGGRSAGPDTAVVRPG